MIEDVVHLFESSSSGLKEKEENAPSVNESRDDDERSKATHLYPQSPPASGPNQVGSNPYEVVLKTRERVVSFFSSSAKGEGRVDASSLCKTVSRERPRRRKC